jgi:hypothetical protein
MYSVWATSLHDVDVEYLDVFLWLLFKCPGVFDLVYHVKTLCRTTEDGMLAIKPRLQKQG